MAVVINLTAMVQPSSFVDYLTTLSVTQILQHRMIGL
jgi:hypothetical protein